jgi:hypothetical protein
MKSLFLIRRRRHRQLAAKGLNRSRGRGGLDQASQRLTTEVLLGKLRSEAFRLVSQPEQPSEKVCELGSRKTHALTMVRARAEQQVLDFGGERGTRTLDLGIMRLRFQRNARVFSP